jgi:hypothetical protein
MENAAAGAFAPAAAVDFGKALYRRRRARGHSERSIRLDDLALVK